MARPIGPSIAALTKNAWAVTASERTRFYAFVVLFVLAYTIDLAVPWAMGYTIGALVEHGLNDDAFNMAIKGVLAYIGLKTLHAGFHHSGRYLQTTVAYSARMTTLNKVFSALLSYPLNWHIGHHSGENLSKLHRSAGAIESTIGIYVWQIIEGLVKVIFASIAIFALDYTVALAAIGMGLVTILLMVLFNKRLTAIIRVNNAFGDKLNRICVDYLFNTVTVKTLGLEKAARSYLQSQYNEGLGLTKRISKFNELKWGTVTIGYGLVIGVSLLIYFQRHRAFGQAIEVAQVYVIISYLERILNAIGSFTGYYSGIIEAATAYEDASKITDSAPPFREDSTTSRIDPKWKVLSFRNLAFSYVEGETAGLSDINLDLLRGEKVALVGPSGGGKSTLLKILAGLLPTETCTISTDLQSGLTIEDLTPISMLLPQEPEIFSETLYYNLTMGEKFKPEEIHFFSNLCRLEGVVEKLPQGWNSNLAEKGLNLSVGEKQRAAMTRGLLRAQTKEILYLDEPTSSLDPKTEKEVFYGLLHHFAKVTVVTACHRLNLVPLFDKVVFVRSGKIEEVGSFDELIQKRGAFYLAWDDYQKKMVKES